MVTVGACKPSPTGRERGGRARCADGVGRARPGSRRVEPRERRCEAGRARRLWRSRGSDPRRQAGLGLLEEGLDGEALLFQDVPQAPQGVHLDLADPLAGDAEFIGDALQR